MLTSEQLTILADLARKERARAARIARGAPLSHDVEEYALTALAHAPALLRNIANDRERQRCIEIVSHQLRSESAQKGAKTRRRNERKKRKAELRARQGALFGTD